jgi:competence protein ComEA
VSFRERLDTLSRAEVGGLTAVLIVTLAGAGLWYSRSLPKPIEIVQTPAPPPVVVTESGSVPVPAPGPSTVSGTVVASTAGGRPIIVHVTGWVRRPGVYQFAVGSRVVDAVERAGGAMAKADVSAVNLAAPLADGQQVVVPKKGTTPTAISPGGVVPSASIAPTGLIDVNTAGATELEEISGIGEVLAAAIVAYRDEHGPFTSIDQLEDVSGIGPSTLEEMRDEVTI